MAILPQRPEKPANYGLVATVLVVAILYFARDVLIPFALAFLLSFLLSPLVNRLRSWKFGRVPSVICVVTLSFLLIGGLGTFMMTQLIDLAEKLPKYQQNIQEKIKTFSKADKGILSRITASFREISKELSPERSGESGIEPLAEPKPVPVEIRNPAFTPTDILRNVVGTILSPLATAGIVIVFVIFMLIQREELRDKVIKLVGTGKLNLTTKAMDDAARRVSRYLLMQLVVNVTYGIPVAIGLYFIGIPNAALWGLMATLLRFIPYVGPWVAAAMPICLAFAVDPGWIKVLLTVSLFIILELISNNILEPLLYGSSTGVSPIAIIFSAVMWTWLWGPIGLLLSTPMTVCLAVAGRHVPSLKVFGILLNDEPVLSPQAKFYQRMLAMDQDEATELAEKALRESSLEDVYDNVIIPALTLAESDRHQGSLSESNQRFINQNTRFLIDDLAERESEIRTEDGESKHPTEATARRMAGMKEAAPIVLCIPARDEADEIAGKMLANLLTRHGVAASTVSAENLAKESLDEVEKEGAMLVCLSAVPPLGVAHARYLAKRIENELQDVKIIVGLWGQSENVDNLRTKFPMAHSVVTSLKDAEAQMLALSGTEGNGARHQGVSENPANEPHAHGGTHSN